MFFRIMGVLSTIVSATILVGGTALLVRSLPEIQRYIKMRSM